MKKVGIMSMQRILNYGSFLQAYALKSILEELDCDVRFVDYHVGECLVSSSKKETSIFRKLNKVLEVLRYKAPLKEKINFMCYKKNYAKKYLPYLGIAEQYNYDTNLDLLVIGSDEVFNCVQDNPNVGYSKELFGKGSNAKRLISYAASCGNTTIEKLDKHHIKNDVAEMLHHFNAISVRDKNTAAVVYTLTWQQPEEHLDPVLIYDFVGKCKQIPREMTNEKYLILYGYSGRFIQVECDAIRAYADAKHLKIYCIGGIQSCCDNFIDCNPFEVISYFQNANCIITDTFHGTILSVITHRQFVSFVRDSGYGNSEKLMDLLQKLNLSDRRITVNQKIQYLIEKEIDYSQVDNIIGKSREAACNYLKENLKNRGK